MADLYPRVAIDSNIGFSLHDDSTALEVGLTPTLQVVSESRSWKAGLRLDYARTFLDPSEGGVAHSVGVGPVVGGFVGRGIDIEGGILGRWSSNGDRFRVGVRASVGIAPRSLSASGFPNIRIDYLTLGLAIAMPDFLKPGDIYLGPVIGGSFML